MRKLTNKEYIEKVVKVHNNFYDYSELEYTNAHDKIKIMCPTHGEFLQRANDHLKGHGCPECARLLTIKLTSTTTDEFIERSNKKHNSRYLYTKYRCQPYRGYFRKNNI